MAATSSNGDELDGVLLYYKYALISDLPSLVDFYESNCRSLALLGRVRLAPDGVNVTIGGSMSSLEQHIDAVKSYSSLFDGTDFKLASCDRPSDERVAKECGFTSLSIRVVKELVTLCSDPQSVKLPEISKAGQHLSATEFHSLLQDAGNGVESNEVEHQKQLVLLDARNLYETRIGKFQTKNVDTMDPEIRQYSDLPAWIDQHANELCGKHVLMYCTGGIRCEMASAYLRSKGEGFENVYQLYGGIQRYLEQFPDGGYFKGKNFVFDHRIAVGTRNSDVLGRCLICSCSYDDYSPRFRCNYCRMLVLVCRSCQEISKTSYVCELCKRHGKRCGTAPVLQDNQLHEKFTSEDEGYHLKTAFGDTLSSSQLFTRSRTDDYKHTRKLKILCLHGFRQNASSFKGRTASLAKKLKHLVEFVYLDAPHNLPFVYQQPARQTDVPSFKDNSSIIENGSRRFAWLVAPNFSCLEEQDYKMADAPFDPLQYMQQTDGFEESYNYLMTRISDMGPFDGVLGFSQGAAMTALICRYQQNICGGSDFRFAVLCSGFSVNLKDPNDKDMIRLPSLHCFGSGKGRDRQIAFEASRKLADQFDKDCSTIIEHDMGHIIPTKPPYIDQMKEFFGRFM